MDAVLPSGALFGPVEGPRSLTLAPGRTVGPVTLRASVPGAAPGGTYTVFVRTGEFQGVVESEDSFTFDKMGAAREGEMTLEDWSIVEVTDGDPLFAETAIPTSEATDAATPREVLPTEVSLAPAYPNPFEHSTTFGFALPEAADVRLVVYDVLGREVALLAGTRHEAGRHEVTFDARGLAGGVYLVRLEAAGRVQTQRITLLK